MSVVAALLIAIVLPQQRDSFLETELIAMGMIDQEVRDRISVLMKSGQTLPIELIKEQNQIDVENVRRLKVIVDQRGWPTSALVGREASTAAFLIVQHATHDLPFMKRCLALMEPHLDDGTVRRADYALLWDRTSLQSGRKQRYGSQVEFKNGKWTVQPCEDPKNLDARRKKMGLPPMKVYLRVIEEVYGKPG